MLFIMHFIYDLIMKTYQEIANYELLEWTESLYELGVSVWLCLVFWLLFIFPSEESRSVRWLVLSSAPLLSCSTPCLYIPISIYGRRAPPLSLSELTQLHELRRKTSTDEQHYWSRNTHRSLLHSVQTGDMRGLMDKVWCRLDRFQWVSSLHHLSAVCS